MPQPSGTTSVAYVLTLLEVASRLGVDRSTLLQTAGDLRETDLADPLTRLPIPALIQLFDAAAKLTGKPHIGLAFGQAVRPASYSGLGYATMTCATLRDAIDLIPRFGRLVFDTGTGETVIEKSGNETRLGEAALPASVPSCIGLDDAVLAGWVSFGRWICGSDAAPLRVEFRHRQPVDTTPYTELFGCPVVFNMPANSVIFSSALLDLRVRDADPHLHLAMLKEAEAQLDRAFAGLSLQQRVRMLLSELLPLREAQLSSVAMRLNISARTLQRRLSEEGCSFTYLMEGLRRDLAERYLREPNLNLVDVALLLGFAEQSSFSHAFRDWYGCSPQEYHLRQTPFS
ncbi:AraC family transcriptional regulator [Chitinimonas sp. BJB300]|uniref:AraC family transcriptional regulator n=1 Tax=Chitinimonas sp. BJB300 TaxID=1559339 RepID=UPI0013047363|nr:AraC family transcriptional regulator [Chitinimonas sp. BJB300]